MRYRLWRSGKTVDLSREKKLGEGGEARVFRIAGLRMAAKVYHHPDPKYAAKLKVMLENPPVDPSSGQGHVSIAWPNDLLLHPDGSFRGYTMPLVEEMLPLVNFYVPKLRRQHRPLFDYYYLVTAALNVATAMRALHDRDYIIGDVNESNILLSDRALATVVDTDSFQVIDSASAAIYRCPVGKPEFTPPELHGKSFSEVDRTREHDCFGLSVMIFQLLMEGTHPFDGVYAQPGDPPPIDERIAAGHFPHDDGANGLWRAKPIAPPFAMLDPALQRLFVQCFRDGHERPSARPDAAAWRAALAQSAQSLQTCTANDRHRHWGHVPCPWCERARRLRGADPFPSVQAVKQGQHLRHRSTGAQTPPSEPRRPMLPPTRPAAPRLDPFPRRRATAKSSPPTSPSRRRRSHKSYAGLPPGVWGGVAGAVLLALRFILWSLAPSRMGSLPGAAPAAKASTDPKVEFLDSPEAGHSFRVMPGMNMIWIAPGTFKMGDSIGTGYGDEKPTHLVYITKGYWIGETDVTQWQWKTVTRSNPSHFTGGSLPVDNMDWNEATAFCQTLTGREHASGALPPEMEYRLPTEAEWEYACRAGTTGDYAGSLDDMAWYDQTSRKKPHEVKTKLPNAWGLYDMHGDVWQWCSDGYGIYGPDVQIDPVGSISGRKKVMRGGSWQQTARQARSAARGNSPPTYRDSIIGVRLAASVTSPSATLAGPLPASSEPASPLASDARPVQPDLRITEGARPGEERWFEIANGVNVAMRWIPGGSFTMGSPDSEAGRSADEAQTKVILSRGFWLAKTECTQKTWRAVMGSNPSHFPGDDLPVEGVSWRFCQTFIGKLRELQDGWRFSLPTEAQWEYACRAGTPGAYAGDLDAMAWHRGNSGETTHPVGMKQPNAWGLLDMHGNVAEWCLDAYGGTLPGGADPVLKYGARHLIRGGSWYSEAKNCRSADRSKFAPERLDLDLGFRLAAVPPPTRGLGGAPGAAKKEEPPERPSANGERPTEPSRPTPVGPNIAFLDSPAPGQSYRVIAGMKMIWIEPGLFRMGAIQGKNHYDERPAHNVHLTTGYWLGETEVTQEQWKAVMGDNPSHFKGDHLPVENVDWNDAAAFCLTLTQSARATGHLPAGIEYRLPTEAQWEYACRAGTSDNYPVSLGSLAWCDLNSENKTHEVRTKRPNAWGLYDMLGNVWEWCSDRYGSYPSAVQVDPTGPPDGSERVKRGGSCIDNEKNCRPSNRLSGTPKDRDFDLGFRVAAALSSER